MSCVIDENTVKYLRERLSTLERSRSDLIVRVVVLQLGLGPYRETIGNDPNVYQQG